MGTDPPGDVRNLFPLTWRDSQRPAPALTALANQQMFFHFSVLVIRMNLSDY